MPRELVCCASPRVRSAGVAWIAAVLLAGVLGLLPGCSKPSASVSDVDKRIAYCESRLDEDPRLYPVHAMLGAAYFDKARQLHDPGYLKPARSALQRSIELQPNFEALHAMAAVCNHTHRFDEALSWIERASSAMPEDSSLVAMKVEALLALGRTEEAEVAVSTPAGAQEDFYRAASRGQIAAAGGRFDEAEAAFSRAAGFAAGKQVRSLELWAEVMAAGAMLDSGQLSRARPHLARAAAIDAANVELRIHQVELLAGEGRAEAALDQYEAIAAQTGDPVVAARAFVLARKLRQLERAARYYKLAEAGFQRAVDAGEIYTLEAIAALYLDAGIFPERAAMLAEENLRFKKDRSARELAARATGDDVGVRTED